MIKDNDNNKQTPKKKAQDLILDKLADLRGYWNESDMNGFNGMTEKERILVDVQLKKECDRIAKRYGFNESWKN